MRCSLIHFVALVLVTLSSMVQAAAPEEQELQRGLASYRNGELAQARAAFLKAIELAPGYAAPRFNLAQLAEREERWTEAARWYGEFLLQDQSSVYAEVARGRQTQMVRYAEADRTPEGQQQRVWLQYLQQAQAHLTASQAGIALAYAELAGQMMPNRFEPKVLHALALIQGERYAEALIQLNAAAPQATGAARTDIEALQARCRDNIAAQARISAADLAFKEARYAQASAAYAELWLLLDQSAYGFSAARSWALAGDEARALKIYDELATSRTVAVANRARQEKETLVARTREAKELRPPGAESVSSATTAAPSTQALAQVSALLTAQKFYEADAQLTQWLDGVLPPPEYGRAFAARAAARLGLREYRGAVQDASIAIVLNPGLTAAYLHRANALAGLGRHAQAAQDLDRAIELTAEPAGREPLRTQKKSFLEKAETP